MHDNIPPTSDNLLLGDSEAGSSAVDWLPLANAVLGGKLVILATALLCAAAAALLVFRIPHSYMATVSMLPPQVNRAQGSAMLLGQGSGDVSALAGLNTAFQTKSQGDIFTVILQAWPIQDELARRFGMMRSNSASDAALARGRVARATSITIGKEGIIHISIADQNPERAAAMANGYIEAARNFLRGMALTEASQRRLFYEGQLESVKRDLSTAEVSFKTMQQKSGMISLDTQARSLVETASGLRAQITAKEVELQSERGYLTPSNPQLQITQTELSALQGQLSQLESRGQGGYSGKSLSSVPGSELEFVRTTRDLKYQEGLYDLMVRQYEGARVDEARDAPTIQVVEPALVPLAPFGPRRARDVTIAFAAGLVLGALINLLRYGYGFVKKNQTFLALRRSALRW